ncbi:MAG: PEP-CTERM sorting domain-containing protein [Phycisphaeraceae bacterium]|nr:PEP-CTERM sorting domain-containing protein [Phycisphaeraceae bacterium]
MKRSLSQFRFVPLALAGATVGLVGSSALADGSDVGLIAQGGRLVTVEAIGEPPMQTFGGPLRVFGVELEFDAIEMLVGVDEPGFATQDAAVLGQSIGFTFTRALRQWNVGLGLFEPTTFTMTAGRVDLGLANVTTPTTDVPTPLSTIPVFPDDIHYFWSLDGATDTTGEGIYLVEGYFTNPGGQLLDSLPVWFVFNYGLDEDEHDLAIDWVADNLVPAPGAVALLAMGGLASLRRRRRA